MRFFLDIHESIQVREYMMQQINSTDDDGLLMNIVIEGMICDTGRKVVNAFSRLESCLSLLTIFEEQLVAFISILVSIRMITHIMTFHHLHHD